VAHTLNIHAVRRLLREDIQVYIVNLVSSLGLLIPEYSNPVTITCADSWNMEAGRRLPFPLHLLGFVEVRMDRFLAGNICVNLTHH